MLDALTSKSTSDTVLRLQKPSAELYLFHDALAPQALRVALAPVFDRLRQTEAPSTSQVGEADDDVIDRLGKLADLLDRGAITHDEFDELKAKLLSELRLDSPGRRHGVHPRFQPQQGRPGTSLSDKQRGRHAGPLRSAGSSRIDLGGRDGLCPSIRHRGNARMPLLTAAFPVPSDLPGAAGAAAQPPVRALYTRGPRLARTVTCASDEDHQVSGTTPSWAIASAIGSVCIAAMRRIHVGNRSIRRPPGSGSLDRRTCGCW